MKKGDLLRYKGERYFPTLSDPKEPSWWIVTHVNKSKKTWHRAFVLFNGRYCINIGWHEREMFEVISGAG